MLNYLYKYLRYNRFWSSHLAIITYTSTSIAHGHVISSPPY